MSSTSFRDAPRGFISSQSRIFRREHIMLRRLCIAALALGLFATFAPRNDANAYGPRYRTRVVTGPNYYGYGPGYYAGNAYGNNGYSAYGNGPYGNNYYNYGNTGLFPSNGVYGNYDDSYGTYYGGYGTSYYDHGNNGIYIGSPYSPFGLGIYGSFNNGW
jgi:hypothetical protein